MQQETEEFDTALYLLEWDRVIALYPLDEQPPTHHNGGNTEWRQP